MFSVFRIIYSFRSSRQKKNVHCFYASRLSSEKKHVPDCLQLRKHHYFGFHI
nr:MAG TPA: hypothetical protein [Bacteriophage sp.]